MQRKIGVAFIALLSTFSVVYAMNKDMLAAPGNPSFVGIQENSKVYMGYYAMNGTSTATDVVFDVGVENVNDFVLLSSQPILETTIGDGVNTDCSGYYGSGSTKSRNYTYYIARDVAAGATKKLDSFVYTAVKNFDNDAYNTAEKEMLINQSALSRGNLAYAFIPTPREINAGGRLGVTNGNQVMMKNARYWLADFIQTWNGSNFMQINGAVYSSLAADASQRVPGDTEWASLWMGYQYTYFSYYRTARVRPFSILDKTKLAFAVDADYDETSIAHVGTPTTKQGDDSIDGALKMRYKDTANFQASLTNLTDLNDVDLSTTNNTIVENTSIKVVANANTGVNHKVSALIYNSTGDEFYYQVLGDAKGNNGSYTLSTQDIPVGDYKIAIVNEEFDSTSNRPAPSSDTSNMMDLTIAKALDMTYTPTPKTGTTVANTYEYSKNVNAGNKIGELSFVNGALPISLSIQSDPNAPSANVNDYKNFDFSASTTSTSPVDIKIKTSGAPNVDTTTSSLKAGDYYFRIAGVDANGLPSPATYVDVKVTVVKTDPVLAFTNTTASNTQTNMLYGKTITEPISTANKDIDYVVNYSANNSFVTVSTEAGTQHARVVSNTSNATGVSTITASIGETANYKAGTATRDINVYDAITSLSFTSVANITASDTTNPGFKVGIIDVIGGSPTYKYSIATNPDGTPGANDNASSFRVSTTSTSATSMDVTTSAQLPAGTYKVTFKIEDNYAQVAYVEATIVVNAIGQAAFDFYDYQNPSNIMTNQTIQIPYGTSNAKLLAKGGSGSGTISYAVADTDVDKGIISVNNTGDITIQKIGAVDVEATKAGSGIYQSATIKMKVEIIPAYQTIAFNTVADTRHKLTGTSTFPELATATLVGGGNPVGGIRYSSSDTSVITIDEAGTVTVVGKGMATITAIINENVSSNTSYNANYQQASTKKKVTIFAGTSLIFNANSPNLRANEDSPATSTGTAITDASVGSISVVPGTGVGDAKYGISTSSDPANADASLFKINANGILQLTQSISASDIRTHIGGNTYKVRVDFNDGNGTEFIDVVVTIEDAKQDLYFTDMNVNKLDSISEVYKANLNHTFQLYTHRYGSGNVTYRLNQDSSTAVVSVSISGLVTILKATDQITPEVVQVEATVAAADGYESKTTLINLVITPAPQTISFKDTTTVARTFVAGSTFLDNAELKEGSAVSSRSITYATSTPSICSIDIGGTITMITTGDCIVTASNSDSNYESTTTSKEINFYTGMKASYQKPLITPQAETPSGKSGRPMGNITVNGGQNGSKTFGIVKMGDPSKNADNAYFTVDESGNLSLAKDVNARDLLGKYDSVKAVYVLKVQVDVSDSLSNRVIVDATIEIKGAPLLAEFDRAINGKITEVYSPAGIFNLNVINNDGGGVPTYRIKDDPNQPQDVLQSIVGSMVTILHANDKSPTGNSLPVMVEAVISASNGYEAKTIEIEVEITKAEQTNFKFKTPTFNMQTSTSFTPEFVGIESKQTDDVTAQIPLLNSTNTNVINVTDGTTLSTNTNEGTNIQINALVKGDRDYKDGITSAMVNVSSQPAYILIIDVPSATYGDAGSKATIFRNGATGGNQIQTWTSSDPMVATIDNSGNLTILKAGVTTIECRQTSDGEPTVTSSAIFVVKPKAITVKLDDKSKLVGEVMPIYTYQPITGLVGDDVLTTSPTFTCLDTDGNPVISSTPSGVYAIQGSYATGMYPNYAIKVEPGDFTITQEPTLASWYSLVGTLYNGWYKADVKVELVQDSGSSYEEIGNIIGTWSSSDFMVSSEGENITDIYFHNATSGAYTSPLTEKIKIDKTAPIIKSITGKQTNKNAISELINNLTFGTFFKPGTKVEIVGEDVIASGVNQVSGLSSIEYEVYRIDASGLIATTPIVPRTSLIPDSSGKVDFTLSDIGMYRVCAISYDTAGNVSSESCSDLNVKKIDVDVDSDGNLDFNDPNKDGCPDMNIVMKDTKGDYYKLNVGKDNDDIPDMDIDSNGKTIGSSPDGIADINVDADKDGTPDLNLVILSKWEPTFCVNGQSEAYCTMKNIEALINVDVDHDGIPDLNIDTGGDMKADINIDANGNGKLDRADSNLTSKLDEWKPEKQYALNSFEYDTMNTLEAYVNIVVEGDTHPSLNIDTDGDGLPNINIDSDGDGIPETNIDGDGSGIENINIDIDNNGTPDENILTISKWDPEIIVSGKVPYKTMKLMYEVKGELEDNGIVIRPKKGNFLPNCALKVNNVTSSISNVDKSDIMKIAGKEREVKIVYDVNLTKDGVDFQPDGNIEVRIPIDTLIKNPKIVLQNKDGSWKIMDAKIDENYFVFETGYIGRVSVVGNKVNTIDNPTNPGLSVNPPSVKGAYVGGVGGAATGDRMKPVLYIVAIIVSTCALLIVGYRKIKNQT